MDLIEKVKLVRTASEADRGKLLRFLAALPDPERLIVMDRHRSYYLFDGLNPAERDFLKYERRDNPAQIDLDFLALAILTYRGNLRRSGKSAEVISEIRDQSRRARIENLRRDTFIIRLRGIYAEVTHLRSVEKLSWPQIAKYLRRTHRKYFGDKPINPDYLRRAYNKLAAERQERAERQNLRTRKKVV